MSGSETGCVLPGVARDSTFVVTDARRSKSVRLVLGGDRTRSLPGWWDVRITWRAPRSVGFRPQNNEAFLYIHQMVVRVVKRMFEKETHIASRFADCDAPRP